MLHLMEVTIASKLMNMHIACIPLCGAIVEAHCVIFTNLPYVG